jgi:hypothetical protein
MYRKEDQPCMDNCSVESYYGLQTWVSENDSVLIDHVSTDEEIRLALEHFANTFRLPQWSKITNIINN